MEVGNVNLLALSTGLFALTYASYSVYAGLTGPLASLPGPLWSKFTGLPIVYHVFHGTRMYYLHELHKRYGPILRITPSEVSITDPSAAKEIHRFRSEYLKTQFYEDSNFSSAQNILTTADPAYHAGMRKLLGPATSQSNVIKFQPVIQKHVDMLILQIERERESQSYVDLVRWFKNFTADVTAELSLGSSLGMLETGEENQYVKDIKRVMPLNIFRLVLWQSPYSQTRHLPFFPFRQLRNVIDRLEKVAKQYIDDYRSRKFDGGSGMPQTILLEKALEVQADTGGVTEDEIIANALMLMLASTDTTANTTSYMLWLVLSHPDIKARLIEEIELAKLPVHPGVDDLASLVYLEQFVLEVLRLYGAAPGPLPRQVPSGGREICGHFVPEGITASPLAYSISRDLSIYANPDKFDMDRWADANATTAMREADFSFGGGNRICLGMHIARLKMKMVVVAFLRSSLRDAELAYGVNGFSKEGMKQLEAIAARPWGDQVLIH
ncbi:cytochrome P450 [Microdochium bolleyi]|uniref:Cytochrome P450 n=1 Tax=Microdochium bolleyi TaxID=196109 RepID=A0A136IVG1_9PEZI|nr:cytochrome P450 [Microdochium bolleyi]